MTSHTAKRKLFALPRRWPFPARVVRDDDLRLTAEHDRLRVQVARPQKHVETVTQDLHLRFVRLAHMRAVLDEDRKDLARVSRNSRAKESPQT